MPPGMDLARELVVQPGDYRILNKRRYDALPRHRPRILLLSREIETLIMTGGCTDICMTATVQHAPNLDFRCYIVRGASRGTSVERHEGALLSFTRLRLCLDVRRSRKRPRPALHGALSIAHDMVLQEEHREQDRQQRDDPRLLTARLTFTPCDVISFGPATGSVSLPMRGYGTVSSEVERAGHKHEAYIPMLSEKQFPNWILRARARLPADGVRNLERAGVPRSVAMELTGHKTEAMYRRYAIVSETNLREAVAKLTRISESRMGQRASDGHSRDIGGVA
jgi:hypothetical protein